MMQTFWLLGHFPSASMVPSTSGINPNAPPLVPRPVDGIRRRNSFRKADSRGEMYSAYKKRVESANGVKEADYNEEIEEENVKDL